MKPIRKRIRMGAFFLSCLLLTGGTATPPLSALTEERAMRDTVTYRADDAPDNAAHQTDQAVLRIGTSAQDASDASPRASSDRIPVGFAGKEVTGNGAKLISDITYVPLRAFVGAITGGKASVTWNAQSRTATVRTSTLTLTAGQGDVYLTANGRCFYTVGGILNLGGTLYVPLRPVAKAFGLGVTWNAATRSVTLTGNPDTYVLPSADRVYDKDELYWLSRIISAESRGEPMTGQIAVGNVVENRVRSREFPNSIYGVIFDRKNGVQFSPVASGTIYATPAACSVAAAKMCLEGYSISRDALYFFNPKLATSHWISKNCVYLFTIGTHRFYK